MSARFRLSIRARPVERKPVVWIGMVPKILKGPPLEIFEESVILRRNRRGRNGSRRWRLDRYSGNSRLGARRRVSFHDRKRALQAALAAIANKHLKLARFQH